MEERIIDLESRLAFAEQTIDELNGEVTAQNRLLADMQKQIDDLKDRFKALSASQIAPESEETPPPHY